ncbi:MAG: hypothetical protein FJ191_09540 [Gammaproteobacteria bacterium]|nr:hypothetical protein [Gammaproteobacteria bacterium]
MADGSTRTAAWLYAVVLFLIVYGSLYPFRFTDVGATGFVDLVARLDWARTTRSDIAANVLLYLPLGASLAWLLAARLGGPLAILLATLAAALVAFAIELGQLYETRRVASLADLCFNTAGAAAGAIVAMLVAAAHQRLRSGALARLLQQPVAVALLVAWGGHRLAPFAPDLSLAGLTSSVRPLWASNWWVPGATLRHALAWLVILLISTGIARSGRALVTTAALMAAVLAGRILFAPLELVPAEIAGMAIALLLARPLLALAAPQAAAALAATLAATVVVTGLTPFDFRWTGEPLALIPFSESLTHYRATNLADMFERCFTAGAMVWLLARSGMPVLAATLLGSGLLFGVELLQTWLPAQMADITDPLLAVAAGGLLAVFESPRRGR